MYVVEWLICGLIVYGISLAVFVCLVGCNQQERL